MSSPASIAKHPIHPMIIGLPIGLFVFSLVSDIIYLTGWGSAAWNSVAYYTMYGGVVTALLAAIPGFIDFFLAVSKGPAKMDGLKHMIANLIVVALFIVNLIIRGNNPASATAPFILSIIGVGILVYSGWLGGEMVYVHAVAVEPQYDSREEMREKGRVSGGLTTGTRYGKSEMREDEKERANKHNESDLGNPA